MRQVTIHLDDEVLAAVTTAAKAAGTSKSEWISEAVRLRVSREWPLAVKQLAGAWTHFPSTDQIRKVQHWDVPREKL